MTRELSAMSSPALSQLPSELLIQIFESLEDFSTVSALGRTSCRLHSIWQANSASICPRILTNFIECPEEANTLFDVQQSLSSPKVRVVGNQAVLDRTKAMISNARMARDILKSFENATSSSVVSDAWTSFFDANGAYGFPQSILSRLHCQDILLLPT